MGASKWGDESRGGIRLHCVLVQPSGFQVLWIYWHWLVTSHEQSMMQSTLICVNPKGIEGELLGQV